MKGKHLSWVIVIVAIIGFTVFACGEPGGGGGKLELTEVSAKDLQTWTGQTAVISFTTSATGDYYYILRRSYSTAPTSEDILNQTSSYSDIEKRTEAVNKGKNEIKIYGLTQGSEYTAYLLAKNQSNTTGVKTVTFTPSAKIIGNWTVTDKSAVWGSSPQIQCVLFAEGKYFAVSNSNIFSSPDGMEWTAQSMSGFGLTGSIYGIAYGNGIIMIGVGRNSILYSEDGGSTWQKGGDPFDGVAIGTYNYPNLLKFAGGKFIISLTEPNGGNIGIPSAIYIAQSADGETWSYVFKDGYTVGNSLQFYDMAYGNGVYIALHGGGWSVSNDGFETNNWTTHDYTWGSSSTYNILCDDTVNPNLFIAGVRRTQYIFGSDGSSIRYVTGPTTISAAGCIVKGDGVYVIGTDGQDIWYSSNGEKWSSYSFSSDIIDSPSRTNLIVYGNGKFIIFLRDGKIVCNG
ncbi:MAG: hypothetical protein LBI28_09305 [Treponema sp.]|jgi:hypothetical protein|nr:hypothetical protein [Treponema sp.]